MGNRPLTFLSTVASGIAKRRKTAVLVVLALAVAVSFASPYVRGASTAAVHQARGIRMIYQLGCVIGSQPSRDPYGFRFEEIARQRYGLVFYTTGGFAPSDSTLGYASGYDTVSGHILAWRFGKDFLARAEQEAKRDVTTSTVELRGCYSRGELQTISGQRVFVWTPGGAASDPDLAYSDRPIPVVVQGLLTEVRHGEWNREFGPVLRATLMHRDTSRSLACPSSLPKRGA